MFLKWVWTVTVAAAAVAAVAVIAIPVSRFGVDENQTGEKRLHRARRQRRSQKHGDRKCSRVSRPCNKW